MNIVTIKRRALPVLRKNHVRRAGIFGSYARGKQKKQSDVDFLIEFKGKRNLLDIVKLKRELEGTLHKNVDVITYKSIHLPLRKRILHEELRIL